MNIARIESVPLRIPFTAGEPPSAGAWGGGGDRQTANELRVYQPLPGKMAKLQNRFRDQLLSIWHRHGIRPVGFWTTLLGESSNELTYILAWESLADRERKWTAFQEDPAWHKVRDESERDGPIVATISSRILTPTAFSALK